MRIERLIGCASLQGAPILGLRRYGVPPGGAFDEESYRLSHVWVGNREPALAIELMNAAIELVFSAPALVAVVGAPGPEVNQRIPVSAGETVSVPAPNHGLAVVIAISGGFLPDGIDSDLGRAGRVLSAGDVLAHGERPGDGRRRLAEPPASALAGALRFVPTGSAEFMGGEFTVSPQSDRTGIRLDGMAALDLPERPSEPACVGAIQATPGGQLIVIGPDGPTIGGYPKIGVVCLADRDRLAHLRPGASVWLEPIDLTSARALAVERLQRLARQEAELSLDL